MGERRVRILEVLDSVTRDVTSELACALADKATEVRHAALRLAERIGDPEIAEIVLEHARGREAEPAAMAIRCLATLKPRGAMQEILEILHSARDAQRVIACCQALGQLGDPSAIQALTKILTPRSFFSLRRGWNSSVRTAAALALSQFDAEEAGDVLARFAENSDPAVRRIALNARGR
jgi:HEAT repeat protein